jgi:hypothetical protein
MSSHLTRSLSAALVLSLSLSTGCSSDDGGEKVDSGGTIDSKIAPDLGGLPDLPQKLPCESEWNQAISPQSTVSSGAVVTTDEGGGVFLTQVDASAGGMAAAQNNPFVYLSFADGKRVDIDDVAAIKSTAWDLALKRVVIRVNGGDSGPGQGAVAVLPGKALADVTAVPASGELKTDDFLDASCTVKTDPIGSIWTAFAEPTGLWYDYDTTTSKVMPKTQVYVVRTADGAGHVKLVIETYYGANGAAGNFKLRWSKLP